jgi:hypothetical protein
VDGQFSKYFSEEYMNKSDPKYLKEACKYGLAQE